MPTITLENKEVNFTVKKVFGCTEEGTVMSVQAYKHGAVIIRFHKTYDNVDGDIIVGGYYTSLTIYDGFIFYDDTEHESEELAYDAGANMWSQLLDKYKGKL